MSEHAEMPAAPTAPAAAMAPATTAPTAASATTAVSTPTPAPAAQTYEQAAARVEEIIRRLDSGEASLNDTLTLLSEGKALIEHCAGELHAVGGALQELRLDELVSRLEQEAGA